MSPTLAIGKQVVARTYADIPDDVVSRCKELILDALACGIAGSRTPIGRVVSDLADQLGGKPQATILGAGFKTACTAAAFVNASAVNAMDYDDTAQFGHPGSTIIPAVLALGERLKSDGRSIIEAICLGYEVGLRVASAINPTFDRYRQVHGIGTPQTFGAAAACAKLLRLNLESTLNAFGIAGASAPVAHAGKFGWSDKSIAFVKDNVAWPAEAGLRAALLAEKGYEGSESILDGNNGFWVMAGSDRCDFDSMTDFSHYKILEVSLKPYPCCRWIHTTLDVVDALVAAQQSAVAEIKKIEVYSIQPLAEFFGKTKPRTFIDVQFSIPCCIALKLYGIPHSKWFETESWQRPEVLELAAKTSVMLDQEYQQLYLKLDRNSARIPARVEITLKDGKKLNGYSNDAWGSPGNPMSREQRLAKVSDLIGDRLSTERQQTFIRSVEHMENEHDICKLMSLL